MEATLHALGGILLKAVPTFLLLVLLHFYLKGVFFKPLQKVLRQRYEATEGEFAELTAARRRAEAAVDEAKAQLSSDVEAAKAGLARDSDLLADQIAESILRRDAA